MILYLNKLNVQYVTRIIKIAVKLYYNLQFYRTYFKIHGT